MQKTKIAITFGTLLTASTLSNAFIIDGIFNSILNGINLWTSTINTVTNNFIPGEKASTYACVSDINGTGSCKKEIFSSTPVTGNYAATKYPLVLAHGLFGFGSIGPINYFHGIPADLASQGAKVYTSTVAAAQSDQFRGEQLLAQVKEIQAITGSAKVNLIGHSQGVQTVRYVAGVRPDLVASVTGIGGSNKGSDIADIMQTYVRDPLSPLGGDLLLGAAIGFVTGFESVLAGGAYHKQDVLSALDGLTASGANAFNQKFPAGIPLKSCDTTLSPRASNGVSYYSWTGTKPGTAPDLTMTASIILGKLIKGESDGIVPKCSAHLGQVIRDNYPQNHFDEVNQVMGIVDRLSPAGDPVPLYRAHANRLKNAGF
ncbi:esterase/lipase family protein [Acinetobacter sp. ANC 3832]|uniref:esterase/lipase family protein n=1 Tax=Acinetobacter sp. ANC 3832 TaxID=1977874 RepID=UPI000A330B70|nr:triacylglycerol lipase [Acinetobacter sp. ANC 3832]OTG87942.1 hypothetical protein B9T35_17405 [Acinetobacter sp. ANC 3832]